MMKMSVKISLIAGLVAIGLAGVFLSSAAPKIAAKSDTLSATAKLPGGPFILVNHHGTQVTDQTYRGQYMLIFFGYTHCPDVCPTTLNDVADVLKLLGDEANKIAPLFITVDPARDTPQILATYVSYFDPRIVGLTGTLAQIKSVATAYKTFFAKAPNENQSSNQNSANAEYSVDHSAFTYFMGPDGQFVDVFGYNTGPELIAKKLRRLLK